MFNKPKGPYGAAKKEKTRDELLAEVRAQRAARGETRQRAQAATTVQAAWRGWSARRRAHDAVASEVLAACVPLVSDPQKPLEAQWVSGWLLPRFLFLVRMPRDITQPVSFVPRRPKDAPSATQLCKVVRPVLALVMRSLLTPSINKHNYMSLLLDTQPASQVSCRQQAVRLAQRCATLVLAPAPPPATTTDAPTTRPPPPATDAVLTAAAVRILGILTDSAQWRIDADTGAKAQAVADICQRLAAMPVPVLAAASRALATPATTATTNTQQPAAAATASSGAAAKLLPVVMQVIQASQLQAGTASSQPQPMVSTGQTQPRQLFWAWFVRLVLTQPGFAAITDAQAALFCDTATFTLLCHQLYTTATTPTPTHSHSHTNSHTTTAPQRPLTACELLWAQANLTHLALCKSTNIGVCGTSPVKSTAGTNTTNIAGATSNAATSWLADDAPAAVAYWRATAALLVAAQRAGLPAGAAAAQGGVLESAARAVCGGLGPLVERRHILAMMSLAQRTPSGVPLLCAVWAEGLTVCQELTKRVSTAKDTSAGAVAIPSFLSSLSFTPGLLPQLWRWLAEAAALPLEAPKEASRGLSVSSLRSGYQSLRSDLALVLGLFCRLYQHLLLVMDDSEFHQDNTNTSTHTVTTVTHTNTNSGGGGGLSLGQARAVVTSLNTLVYHTYLPVKEPKSSSAAPSPIKSTYNSNSNSNSNPAVTTTPLDPTLTSSPPDSLLSTYAPTLLRALYERDTRRPYCQPQLWLAPYQDMFGSIDKTIDEHRNNLLAAVEQMWTRGWGGAGAGAGAGGGDQSDGEVEYEGSHSSNHSNSNNTRRSDRTGGGGGNAFTRLFTSSRRGGGGGGGTAGAAPAAPAGGSALPWSAADPTAAAAGGNSGGGVGAGLLAWAAGLPEEAQSGRDVALDPRAARIGPFRAGRVVAALLGSGVGDGEGEGEEGGEEEVAGMPGVPGLKVRAAEGARPESLASLLRIAPQTVPFDKRVELFRALLAQDRANGGFDRAPYEGGPYPIQLTIHRSRLMDDAYRALAGRGGDLKARLMVVFISEAGTTEAGLDYGGLMKEFLEEVVVRGFHADAGLWAQCASTGDVYPRPSAHRMESGIQLLEFLGLMVGKALYEGILLNVSFAPFFITRLQGRTPQLDDLRTLDPDLHRSLMQIKTYEGDVSDLGLTFSVEDDYFGQTIQHALLPGQANTPVTNDNKLLYCHLLADWHLNVQLGRAAEAFSRGLSSLIPLASLRLFSPQEFNQLISGGGGADSAALNVEDMKRYARYSGGYRPDSTAVKLLWQVLSDFTPEQRGKFLRFVTSCSRAPLGGFRYLQPPLTIHKVDCEASLLASIGGKDVDRLPTASTCFNTLKLPNYRRKDTLRQKLLYALGAGAGFELS